MFPISPIIIFWLICCNHQYCIFATLLSNADTPTIVEDYDAKSEHCLQSGNDNSDVHIFRFGRRRRAATALKERLWPNGVIPYEISNNFSGNSAFGIHFYSSGEHKYIFQQAMRHWENYTCITFIPRQKYHTDYIFFTVDKCGCCSYVGRRGGGPQAISIGKNCDKFGIVVHELGHVIGFWHEHTRIDRDDHVTILYKSIQQGQDYNFDKLKANEVDSLGEPYDFASIMHYSKDTFSKAPYLHTILPKHVLNGKRPEIGQRYRLSTGDIRQTNKLYHCPACFKTMTADNGNLWLENHSCVWRIIGPLGGLVRISVLVPGQSADSECLEKTESYVVIRDGYYAESPVIGKICGGAIAKTFVSSSNRLYIQAYSSTTSLFSLFAHYENGNTIVCTSTLFLTVLCGGILRNGFGTIQSPQFPESYRPNQRCEWTLEMPINHQVALRINYFEIEFHKGCIYDRLEIYDGDEAVESKLIAKLCGHVTTKVITSNSNIVFLRFLSDSSIQKAGFHIDYIDEQNECEVPNFHDCQQQCVNEVGGYHCACNIGYSLREDGRTCESTCGGYIKSKSGAFFSPGYPLDYPSSQDCIWEIEASEGYQIIVNFTHFDVEGMKTECAYDYVSLTDEFGKEERYCGFYDELLVYTSASNRLKARFVSDATVEKSGFAAYFVTDLDECQNNKGGCEQICINTIGSYRCECDVGFVLSSDGRHCKEGGCHFQLHDSEGEITSPGYPLDYPNEKFCDWHIVTTPGHRLVIAFEEFEFEEQNLCKYDRLELFDGGSSLSKLLGIFCGSVVPRSIYTTSNELFISFSSDESVTRRGFKAFYSSACGGNMKAEKTVGYIYSHARYGDDKYEKNSNCEWRLLAPPKKSVRIEFLQFDLENDLNCAFDYVEIFDGWEKTEDALIGRYCGEMVIPVVGSTERKLLIIFKTDDSEERKGFMIEYRSAILGTMGLSITRLVSLPRELLINND